jgi:hypothetical protein
VVSRGGCSASCASLRPRRGRRAGEPFALAPRATFGHQDLAAAAARLRAELAAGRVPDDDLVAETDLYRRWQDLLARQAGGK